MEEFATHKISTDSNDELSCSAAVVQYSTFRMIPCGRVCTHTHRHINRRELFFLLLLVQGAYLVVVEGCCRIILLYCRIFAI